MTDCESESVAVGRVHRSAAKTETVSVPDAAKSRRRAEMIELLLSFGDKPDSEASGMVERVRARAKPATVTSVGGEIIEK